MPSRPDIRVWQFDVPQAARQAAALWEVLRSDEQHHAQKFHFAADRDRFVAGRGHLRRLLAQELQCDPSDVEFQISAQGKPELRPSAESRSRLYFNVSHSGGLVLIAIADEPLGVDVEKARAGVDVRALAERFYCPSEWNELKALEGHEQSEAFLRCWTRKEAIVKALGRGLSVPLNGFYAGTDSAHERIVQTSDGQRWKVWAWIPASGYAAAVATEARGQLEWLNFLGRPSYASKLDFHFA